MSEKISRPESHVAENKPDYLPENPYKLLLGCTYEVSHQETMLSYMGEVLGQYFEVENISVAALSKSIGSDALQSKILSIIHKFDIFVILPGKPLFDFDFLKKVKKANDKIAIAHIDGDGHMNYVIYTSRYAEDLDLFISLDSIFIADYLSQRGIRSVCLGNIINRQDFHPLENIEPDIDVSFYGGVKGDREGLLDLIRSGGFDLQCFGSRFGGKLSQKELNKIICRSKIGVCFNKHGENPAKIYIPKTIELSNHIKGRNFEYMLCGRFPLSEKIEHIDRFFVPDKELVSFETDTELLEKIRYYLDHQTEREEIAEAGHKKVMTYFEGTKQIKKMANLLIKVANDKNGRKETYSEENLSYDVKPIPDIDAHDASRRHFVNFRTSLALKFFKEKKYYQALAECKAWRYGLPGLFVKTQLKLIIFSFLGGVRQCLHNTLNRLTNVA